MGVTFLQHRIVTGMHVRTLRTRGKRAGKSNLNKAEILTIIYSVMCVIYTYLICMLLAGAVKTSCSMTDFKFHVLESQLGVCCGAEKTIELHHRSSSGCTCPYGASRSQSISTRQPEACTIAATGQRFATISPSACTSASVIALDLEKHGERYFLTLCRA